VFALPIDMETSSRFMLGLFFALLWQNSAVDGSVLESLPDVCVYVCMFYMCILYVCDFFFFFLYIYMCCVYVFACICRVLRV